MESITRFPNFATPTISLFHYLLLVFIGETVISQSLLLGLLPTMIKEMEPGYSGFVLFLMNLTIFLRLNCPTTRVTFAAKSVRRSCARITSALPFPSMVSSAEPNSSRIDSSSVINPRAILLSFAIPTSFLILGTL